MKTLNRDSLRELYERCRYNRCYCGAILFNSKIEAEFFALALQHRGHELDFLKHNFLKAIDRVIYFKNGSRISLITVDFFRGKSYHEILYYKTVPLRTLEYARLSEFKYTEQHEYFPWAYETKANPLYAGKRLNTSVCDAEWNNTEPVAIDSMDREENNAELDRFLNSFKVDAQ